MTVSHRLSALTSGLVGSLALLEAYNSAEPEALLTAVLTRRRVSARQFCRLAGQPTHNAAPLWVEPGLAALVNSERRLSQHIDQLLPRMNAASDLMPPILELRAEVDEALLSLRLVEQRLSRMVPDGDTDDEDDAGRT